MQGRIWSSSSRPGNGSSARRILKQSPSLATEYSRRCAQSASWCSSRSPEPVRSHVNLPNAVTAGRIAVTPLIAWLPLAPSSALRFTAFALFVVAAVTDYVDGRLARSRKQETDLGRLLDPLADKLLLVATIVPMYLLMRPTASTEPWPMRALDNVLPFRTPFGDVPLAWWMVAVV